MHEIRYNDDGTLDEVIVSNPSFFHLECMGEHERGSELWWMRINAGDDAAIVIWFDVKKGNPPRPEID